MPKPISVQLYTLRDEAAKDFSGVLRKLGQTGFVGVEFAGLHGMSAEAVARVLHEAGLKASSAHVPLPTPDNLQSLADEAAILGYTRLISGFGPDDMKTLADAERCGDRLAEACELAKSVGLSFGMHNHWWEFDHAFGGKTPFDVIMQKAPALFSELDVYWASRAGADPAALVKHWGKRIPLLHIKDGDLGPQHVHTAVGQGKVKMPPILAAADPAVLEWVVVELDACATDMMTAVVDSYRYLTQNGLAQGRV